MPAGFGGQLKWPATAQPVFSSSSSQLHPLGARAEDIFGREYRYCLVGGTSLVAGDAIQAAAQVAAHQDRTPVAAAIDDRVIDISLGATAITANDYAGGIAVIDTTPGLGYSYPIKGHLAADSSATTFDSNLAEGWTIQVALTTTSRVSLYANPYSRVIQSPVTTLTNTPAGVAVYPITNAQYGWLGVHGHFGTLIQGTPGVGVAVGPPGSAAGAVAVNTSTNPIVGFMMDTGQDAKVEGVFWIL